MTRVRWSSEKDRQGYWTMGGEAMRQHESEAAAVAFHLERADQRLAEVQAASKRAADEAVACSRTAMKLLLVSAAIMLAAPLALIARLLAYSAPVLAVTCLVVAAMMVVVGVGLAVRVVLQHRAAMVTLRDTPKNG